VEVLSDGADEPPHAQSADKRAVETALASVVEDRIPTRVPGCSGASMGLDGVLQALDIGRTAPLCGFRWGGSLFVPAYRPTSV